MSPLEVNARILVGVLVQHLPTGGTCEDLRRAFEADTGLARQSFYNALNYCKKQGWLIGGARERPDGGGRDRRDHFQLYILNPDGSWKPPPASIGEPVGEPLSRDQLEYLADTRAQQIGELQSELACLRNWTSGDDANGANTALTSLLRIIADNGASVRQRIRASAAVLGYKTQGDVAEFVRKYLQFVCESTNIAIDYKIEAGELLRRHEAPRVTPESVRPSYSGDSGGTEAERREAWRRYAIAARELQIILATKDTPLPGWADDLYADDYVPPPEGWPGPVPTIPLKDLVVARKARQDRLCPESVDRSDSNELSGKG